MNVSMVMGAIMDSNVNRETSIGNSRYYKP
jgi:hypothetical protein